MKNLKSNIFLAITTSFIIAFMLNIILNFKLRREVEFLKNFITIQDEQDVELLKQSYGDATYYFKKTEIIFHKGIIKDKDFIKDKELYIFLNKKFPYMLIYVYYNKKLNVISKIKYFPT